MDIAEKLKDMLTTDEASLIEACANLSISEEVAFQLAKDHGFVSYALGVSPEELRVHFCEYGASSEAMMDRFECTFEDLYLAAHEAGITISQMEEHRAEDMCRRDDCHKSLTPSLCPIIKALQDRWSSDGQTIESIAAQCGLEMLEVYHVLMKGRDTSPLAYVQSIALALDASLMVVDGSRGCND